VCVLYCVVLIVVATCFDILCAFGTRLACVISDFGHGIRTGSSKNGTHLVKKFSDGKDTESVGEDNEYEFDRDCKEL